MAFLIRHRLLVHLFTLILVVVTAAMSMRLGLRTDFAELLPQTLPSVRALKTASERIGGIGLLIVGVDTPNFADGKRFVDDFAKQVEPWVGKDIRFIEYQFNETRDFIQRYGLYYLNDEQLRDLRATLDERLNHGIDQAVGDFLGLDDHPAPQKDSGDSLEQMFSKHPAGPMISSILNYPDGYLSAHDGQVLAIAMRPQASSLSLGETRRIVAQTEEVIRRLDPKKYNAKMQVVLAGSLPQAIEEFETVRHDIVGTAVELTLLIVAILFLFLWSVPLILLLAVNLVVAVLATFALTWWHIGFLNTQTAFLGSLVVGTGINYGVIYLSRYLERRRSGEALQPALARAIEGTMVPTFVASTSTAASFIVLMMASNQGLAQFGYIGSVGVLLCWVCSFFLLPLWVYELERLRPARAKAGSEIYANPLARRLRPWGEAVGEAIVAHPRWILTGVVALTLISTIGAVRLICDPLEYDFSKLRNRTAVSSETEALRDRVYDAFPTSLTPSLAMAENEADARAVCPAVRKLINTLPPERNLISSCGSFYDLLPPQIPGESTRAQLMRDVTRLLSNPRVRFAEQGDFLRGMGQKTSPHAPTREDMPEQILRRFREQSGAVGLFSTINPKGGNTLNDGRNLLNFTESLTPLRVEPSGSTVLVAGDSFVLADILRELKHEGPRLTVAALVSVLLLAFFLAGGWRSGLLMSLSLLLGTWLMLGMQGALGLRYNFFNFIALPLTFGIGIDYPINMYVRMRQEGFRNFGKVFATTGMAVVLCSATTAIGYYTLLGASSQALAGFGQLGILGEMGCMVAAMFLVPVLVTWRMRAPAAGAGSGSAPAPKV